MKRAERQQRMVDAVLRQDDDRALGRETARDEGAADGARRPPGLAVADAPPRAGGVALGEEDPLRRPARPVLEPLAEPARIGSERLPRAQDQPPIRAPLDLDIGWGEEKVGHGLLRVAEAPCVLRDAPTALLRMR
jgi:hypothetical protein